MSQRAGWYDDPENSENLRYFDGVLWTSHTTPRTSPTAGQTTIGLSDGTAHTFVPGDVRLIEDTTGKGHTTIYQDGLTITMQIAPDEG